METVNKLEIGNRIRRIRKDLGLRQWQLANLLGSTQPAIHKYENGAVPEVGRLLRLAEIGHTSVEWILTGRHGENGSSRRERVGTRTFQLAERLQRISGEQARKLESVLELLEAALGTAPRSTPHASTEPAPEGKADSPISCDPQTVAALRSALSIHSAVTEEPRASRSSETRRSSGPPLAARGL